MEESDYTSMLDEHRRKLEDLQQRVVKQQLDCQRLVYELDRIAEAMMNLTDEMC